MKKTIAIILTLICIVGCFASCTAASNVNHNLSQAADNFQVVRKITVYNARTDMIVMEMEGIMSLSNNTTSELVVTCQTGPQEYKKNYVYLNDYEHVLVGKTYIECIGGKHNVLGLSNESEYFGNGISFCATCDGPLYKDKNVVIIGGGNSAVDFALTLSKYCREVEIIHRRDKFRADFYMVNKLSTLSNVNINFNTNVTNIIKNEILNTFEITTNTEMLTNIHQCLTLTLRRL